MADETLIPTCSFRWFVDYDGERILQQRFQTTGGKDQWKSVPTFFYYDEREEAGLRRKLPPVRPFGDRS